MVKTILEKLRTDGSVIYRIDRQKKTDEYIINSDSSQAKYRLDLADKLRKQNIPAHIVRPRGFIIVGRRSDLKNEDMLHDFRILNDALKNIDLIFYDDLLTNLKVLHERLVCTSGGRK
jgi:Domain of unknown function (DUF4263)